MVAFALTLAIFGIWSLIGWAVVGLLNGGRNLICNALLSPVAGAAIVALTIFEFNRWGFPVRACGPAVTLAGAGIAAALIWRFHLIVPWRRLVPFQAVLAAGTLLVGYPMFLNGFDWLSFGNDDMAYYILAAGSFLKRAYLAPFDPRLILENRDVGLAQWIAMILTGARCGAELTLAWVMSLTGLSGPQIFMPVNVAFHMALICAAGALIVRGRTSRQAGVATCAWVAASSLITLGTVYQLISQTFGLGLLAGAGTVLLQPNRHEPRRVVLKRALLGALFCAAIGVTYPEVLPFLVLSFGLVHAIALWRRKETISSLIRPTAITLAATVLLWNSFTDSVFVELFSQAGRGLRTTAAASMLFPYYLLPSGLATFWGFLPMAQRISAPWLDAAIAAAALLLVVAALAVFRQAWQEQPVAAIALVMFALAIRLAWTQSDFGLYKVAMYCQPFVLGSLVVAWFGWLKKTATGARLSEKYGVLAPRLLPIVLIAALGLPAQLYYVKVSAGRGSGRSGFVEVPDASSRHLISRLLLLGRAPHDPLVISDTSNVVLAKIEANYFTPSRQEFPAADYFSQSVVSADQGAGWYARLVRPEYIALSDRTLRQWHAMQHRVNFDMLGGPRNSFVSVQGADSDTNDYSLLASGPFLSVLNRRQPYDLSSGSMTTLVASERVRNHLIQIDSELGRNYYRAGAARGAGLVATFQLEPDYFYPRRSMSAVGRMILFEVLHPSPRLRLQVDFTGSLQSDGRNTIPPMQAIGAQRAPLGAIGRGSARLFSPPMETQTIGGRHYVAVDMGAVGQRFGEHRTGLMRLYGTSIPLDSRRITGFLRDVSAVDAEQYDHLQAPTSVEHYPADLACDDLEYSGIYEDGWVAEDSFLRLRQPPGMAVLMVRTMVPALGQKAPTLRVFVDGKPVAQSVLKPGDNEVRAMVEGPAATRRIDLRFDSVVPLHAPDNRLVSAQLKFVGFHENGGGQEEIAQAPIAIGGQWYPFEKFGGQTFRWVENHARFAISSPARQSGELAIDFEPGPGMRGKPLALHLVLPDGSTRILQSVTGRQTVSVPLALRAGVNDLWLGCEGGGLIIPSDPRTLNFRVFTLTWTPRSSAR